MLDTLINVCTDEVTLQRGLEVRKRFPWIHLAAAVHPHDAHGSAQAFFDLVSRHARMGDLVGVGETGLDYFYHHAPKTEQQEALRRSLRLALQCKLPVIIHCREAFEDLFPILEQEYKSGGTYAPGVLHCFTGNLEEAKKVLDRGWLFPKRDCHL